MNNLPASSQPNLIKEGDIFQIGDHFLACGKAEDKILLEKMLQKKKINLILTDPPYGVAYVEGKAELTKIKERNIIVNDHLQSEQEYVGFTQGWIQAIKPHLSLPNSMYVFNTDKMAFSVKQAVETEGGKYSQLLIWVKNRSVLGRLDYNPQHELIVYGWFGKHKFYKSKDKSILYHPKPNKSSLHPTMKPISLLRQLILNGSKMGDVVWDGFGGSGSTLLACQQTRRICIMTELSPDYCQVIIDRVKKTFPDLPIKKL